MSTKYHELLSKSIMNVSKQTTNLRTTILHVAKKAAVTMAFLLTLSASFAFSGTNGANDINSEIRTSFKKDFRNAQLLSTESHKAFTKLTFKMDGLIMSAFYSGDGELLAVTRNILSTQLPINLMMSLRNDYNSYWITELFEFTGDNDSCYYVSLENADSKVTLRSNGDQWEVYSSVKK
jgi:hypothetical protein